MGWGGVPDTLALSQRETDCGLSGRRLSLWPCERARDTYSSDHQNAIASDQSRGG